MKMVVHHGVHAIIVSKKWNSVVPRNGIVWCQVMVNLDESDNRKKKKRNFNKRRTIEVSSFGSSYISNKDNTD